MVTAQPEDVDRGHELRPRLRASPRPACSWRVGIWHRCLTNLSRARLYNAWRRCGEHSLAAGTVENKRRN
ncbi:MAG: hypothetical protein ACLUEQ_10925 [Cloacibacillus evryensis]